MKKKSVSPAPENESYRAIRIFVLCFAGCFFLAAFIYSTSNCYRLLTFEKTFGEIASIDSEQTTGKLSATIYDLWIGFKTEKLHIYTRAGKSVFYKPYEKGEKPEVYYDPQNPNDAFINTFGTIWFVPTLLSVIGLVPLFMIMPGRKELREIYQKRFGLDQKVEEQV
ncbi:MAG: DUF3592 domain-containing protein [Pyrinomonadaceae bacterium]